MRAILYSLKFFRRTISTSSTPACPAFSRNVSKKRPVKNGSSCVTATVRTVVATRIMVGRSQPALPDVRADLGSQLLRRALSVQDADPEPRVLLAVEPPILGQPLDPV